MIDKSVLWDSYCCKLLWDEIDCVHIYRINAIEGVLYGAYTEEQLKTYIKNIRGISDKTVQNYITGLQSINAILQENHFKISNVFAVTSFEELDEIKAFLDSNEEYLIKDTITWYELETNLRPDTQGCKL